MGTWPESTYEQQREAVSNAATVYMPSSTARRPGIPRSIGEINLVYIYQRLTTIPAFREVLQPRTVSLYRRCRKRAEFRRRTCRIRLLEGPPERAWITCGSPRLDSTFKSLCAFMALLKVACTAISFCPDETTKRSPHQPLVSLLYRITSRGLSLSSQSINRGTEGPCAVSRDRRICRPLVHLPSTLPGIKRGLHTGGWGVVG